MKICFLNHSLSLKDGLARYGWDFLNALTKKGINCRILLPKNSEVEDIENVEIFKVLSPLENGQIKLKNTFWDFLKVLKYTRNCQMIHAIVEPYAFLVFLSAKILNKPYYITAHGTFAPVFLSLPIKSLFFKIAFKKAEKIFCVSNFTKNFLAKLIPEDNFIVIPNGVNLEKCKKREYCRGFKEGSPLILSVGVLRRRKGFHISIPAVAEIKKQYPHLKYYIVGRRNSPDYFNQLQELVRRYDLGENVVFLENLTDEERNYLYDQSDLFILSSIVDQGAFEGFGLVYLEANAFSKPVIGTLDCGAEDAIRDGYNGFLVPQNDVAALTRAILKILDNPELAKIMGRNGRKWAEEHEWDKIAEEYLRAYG